MKWYIQISSGYFMTGIHPFNTKKSAVDFVNRYMRCKQNTGAFLTLYRGKIKKDRSNAIESFQKIF